MPHKANPEGFLSVTEVLSLTIDKPYLAWWRGKIGNEAASKIQRESQEIGIEVHRLIEDKFKGTVLIDGDIATNNSLRMANNFWNKFVIPYEVKLMKAEQTLQDKKLKLQGTYDGYIQTNKGVYVADWKTSSRIDKISVPLQLSAYGYLGEFNNGVVVRIDKESDKVEVKWYENLEQYWPIFKAAMKLARWIKFGEV